MIEQIFIAITGVTGIWLTQQNNEKLKRYACILGMLGQPFWFYSSYQAGQWGIFLMSFFYTFAWGVGIKNNWLSKKKEDA